MTLDWTNYLATTAVLTVGIFLGLLLWSIIKGAYRWWNFRRTWNFYWGLRTSGWRVSRPIVHDDTPRPPRHLKPFKGIHPILRPRRVTGRKISEVDIADFGARYLDARPCYHTAEKISECVKYIVESWAPTLGFGKIKNAKLIAYDNPATMHRNFDVVIDSKGWTG